ncbi:uracil-DNA glycosylase [Alkaliphilus serpentinus]|uniref:Uracil-DNA glycosylase n=1 Tax=Alkaliphilus serpentinus TaxID=1482731 RepID=A0A833HKZ3_9FIRM|nr:uracil-DNA glycosylase [Alkaliphilus serpentinus]
MINCNKCKYFYITWEAYQPKGCHYFGFKSKKLPSLVVLETSGKECQAYRSKDAI